MAASLQPQLKMLLSAEDFCGDLSSSYLRSILDCAYAFGCTAGILWGCLADRVGRRPVALAGLFSMAICCMAMGLAKSLGGCAIFRFVAGLVSSAVTVTALTMIGDISPTPVERAVNVARLPLVAVCGSIGPLVQGMVAGSIKADGAIWQKFPALSSQIACGSLVFLVAVSASIMLQEVSNSHIACASATRVLTSFIDLACPGRLQQDHGHRLRESSLPWPGHQQ